MIKKIILFANSTFDDRDYKRFGIDLLKSNGFEVEVWDCFPFLNPKAFERLKAFYQPTFIGYHRFESLDSLLSSTATLSDSCFMIIPFFPSLETVPIYKAISQTPAKYAFLNLNLFPAPSQFWVKTLIHRIAKLTPSKFWNALLNRRPMLYSGIKAADVVVAGGSGRLLPFEFTDRSTKTLWAHTMDYDNYLEFKNSPRPEGEDYGVFIDQAPPFHPDAVYSGEKPIATEDRYYPALRRFFDLIEKDHRTRIVIAAHPRSSYKSTDTYYGDRAVIRDKTVELIKNSSFVLMHFSTAINYAVLFMKPILFISTQEIDASQEMAFLRTMANWFHKKPIHVESVTQLDWKSELAIQPEAYTAYKEAFIKTVDSPEKPLWQIVSDYVKELH